LFDANTVYGRAHPQEWGDVDPRAALMSIDRIAWSATVFVALLTALLLLLAGYTGYAGLGLAVALSAAINLF